MAASSTIHLFLKTNQPPYLNFAMLSQATLQTPLHNYPNKSFKLFLPNLTSYYNLQPPHPKN